MSLEDEQKADKLKAAWNALWAVMGDVGIPPKDRAQEVMTEAVFLMADGESRASLKEKAAREASECADALFDAMGD